MEPSKALIGVIALVVLVFVLQLIVGVFGTATATVNNTLVQVAGANSVAVSQFHQTGQATTTIIPFINIIVLVALVVILLALFGLKKILDIGSETG